jgi:hypothetical protein
LPVIAEMLAAEGFAHADGTSYTVPELRAILHEPFYAGRNFNGHRFDPRVGEPLIDRATFAFVQAQLGPDSAPAPMNR